MFQKDRLHRKAGVGECDEELGDEGISNKAKVARTDFVLHECVEDEDIEEESDGHERHEVEEKVR